MPIRYPVKIQRKQTKTHNFLFQLKSFAFYEGKHLFRKDLYFFQVQQLVILHKLENFGVVFFYKPKIDLSQLLWRQVQIRKQFHRQNRFFRLLYFFLNMLLFLGPLFFMCDSNRQDILNMGNLEFRMLNIIFFIQTPQCLQLIS